jgi:hypothetical protein
MRYVPLQGQSEERPATTGSGCKHRPVERECRSEPKAHGSDSNGGPSRHQRRPATWTEEGIAKVRPVTVTATDVQAARLAKFTRM